MASWQRFKALWTHRYKKYSHIGRKYVLFGRDYCRLSLLKIRLRRRPLVVILLTEQFGDIVACEPVGRKVREMHPDGHILWMVRKPYVELVKDNPHLDGYFVEYCVSHRLKLLQSGVFDSVYNMHLSHRNCQYCGDDHVNPIADKLDITYTNYYFHGDLLHVFSMAAGLPPLDDAPRLYVSEEAKRRVAALNLPPHAIVLHCKPSYPERDWLPQNWNRLVMWLLETYPYPVIEVGLENLITVDHPRYLNLCGQLSILETSEVIRHGQLYIGVDSGPAHLANAVGIDAIILLGRTGQFDEFLPYSGRYKHTDALTLLNRVGYHCADLPYEWVEDAVKVKLPQPVVNKS